MQYQSPAIEDPRYSWHLHCWYFGRCKALCHGSGTEFLAFRANHVKHCLLGLKQCDIMPSLYERSPWAFGAICTEQRFTDTRLLDMLYICICVNVFTKQSFNFFCFLRLLNFRFFLPRNVKYSWQILHCGSDFPNYRSRSLFGFSSVRSILWSDKLFDNGPDCGCKLSCIQCLP